MERKFVKIKIIEAITPIDGADSIELITFDDCSWQCVAKKGEFKQGDQCVYFEIDSLLPSNNPAFDFLAHSNSIKTQMQDGKEYKGYRLRTIKLRGELSQGLALPLSSFDLDLTNDDLDGQLGVVKYDPVILTDGSDIGAFESLVPKTDEERVQNLKRKFEHWQDIDMVATEKLDGTSCTIIYQEGKKRLFSRNLEKKVGIGHKYDVATENIYFPNDYAVQGEIIGSAIQGNSYKQNGVKFYAFNVFDILKGDYLNDLEFNRFCDENNIPKVPVIWEGKLSQFDGINGVLKFAEGKSNICETTEREGLVFRNLEFDKGKRISFKAISNKFLLKEK